MKTFDDILVKMGQLDSLMYSVESAMIEAAPEDGGEEVIRLHNLIYLLWDQLQGGSIGNAVAAAAGAVVVIACKLAGWTAIAVPLAAVIGVIAAMAATCASAGKKGGEAK